MDTPNYIQDPSKIVLPEQDEIQTIIGNPPSWILRWGITIILVLVALFGTMSWVIKYPDVLSTPLIISTENPVIRVVNKTSGKIDRLLVTDQSVLSAGTTLAVLESNAQWEDIQRIVVFLDQIGENPNLNKIKIPESLTLGTFQGQYTQLVQLVKSQQYDLRQNDVKRKLQATQDQISHYEQLNQRIENQIAIFKEELQLKQNAYQIDLELQASGASSNVEVTQSKTQFLQAKRQLESMEAQVISNQLTRQQLHNQLADLKQNRKDDLQNGFLAIEDQVRQLHNSISVWEQTYLLKAPIDGQLNMTEKWSPQQFVAANTEMFTLIPQEGAGEIIALATMPPEGIAKIQSGMSANIILAGYPQVEYGLLKARVDQIALVPETRASQLKDYAITLRLENGLKTTYGKEISLRQEMPGTAEIITEDKRILERILEQILNILKNK